MSGSRSSVQFNSVHAQSLSEPFHSPFPSNMWVRLWGCQSPDDLMCVYEKEVRCSLWVSNCFRLKKDIHQHLLWWAEKEEEEEEECCLFLETYQLPQSKPPGWLSSSVQVRSCPTPPQAQSSPGTWLRLESYCSSFHASDHKNKWIRWIK